MGHRVSCCTSVLGSVQLCGMECIKPGSHHLLTTQLSASPIGNSGTTTPSRCVSPSNSEHNDSMASERRRSVTGADSTQNTDREKKGGTKDRDKDRDRDREGSAPTAASSSSSVCTPQPKVRRQASLPVTGSVSSAGVRGSRLTPEVKEQRRKQVESAQQRREEEKRRKQVRDRGMIIASQGINIHPNSRLLLVFPLSSSVNCPLLFVSESPVCRNKSIL